MTSRWNFLYLFFNRLGFFLVFILFLLFFCLFFSVCHSSLVSLLPLWRGSAMFSSQCYRLTFNKSCCREHWCRDRAQVLCLIFNILSEGKRKKKPVPEIARTYFENLSTQRDRTRWGENEIFHVACKVETVCGNSGSKKRNFHVHTRSVFWALP